MKYGSQFLKDNAFMILITIIGLALRLYDLGSESFWFDETISSIAAIALSENGVPVFPSGFVYSRAILNTFFIALSFGIFGVDEFAGRLPSVLFGVLTIVLVYHMGSKWGNEKIGIFAAIMVALSVWEIAWSRQARMYQQLQFFYILSLYLFYEYVSNRTTKNLFLLVISFIATILSHVFGYILVVVFSLFLVFSFLKNRQYMNMIGKRTALYVALLFIFLLGLAYEKGVISHVIETHVNYYDEYIYFLKKGLGFSLFLAVPGATLLFNKDWRKGLLIVLSVVIPLYVIFFHVLLFAVRYLYFVTPLLFILAAYFLDSTIDYLSQIVSRRERISEKVNGSAKTYLYLHNSHMTEKVKRSPLFVNVQARSLIYSMAMIILVIMMHLSPAFTLEPKTVYDLGPNAPLSDFKKAYSYVDNNMMPGDVVVSTWTAPAQFYLGKNDYWLGFNVVGTGMGSFTVKNGTRDVYSNSSVIKDTSMLRNVTLDHERGWIVTDALGWRKISPQTRDYIDAETKLELRDSTIRVYLWDNTNRSEQIRL
jgi:hypothetical protein